MAKLVNNIAKWFSVIGTCFIGAMMLTIVSNVTMRYLFSGTIKGAIELVSLLMVGAVFLSLAYTQIAGGHIKVELVLNRLSSKSTAIVNSVTYLLALAILILFTWGTIDQAIHSWQTKEYYYGLMKFPLYPGRTLIPIGVLMLLAAVFLYWFRAVQKALGSGTK